MVIDKVTKYFYPMNSAVYDKIHSPAHVHIYPDRKFILDDLCGLLLLHYISGVLHITSVGEVDHISVSNGSDDNFIYFCPHVQLELDSWFGSVL